MTVLYTPAHSPTLLHMIPDWTWNISAKLPSIPGIYAYADYCARGETTSVGCVTHWAQHNSTTHDADLQVVDQLVT